MMAAAKHQCDARQSKIPGSALFASILKHGGSTVEAEV
jgi:hypothetical protein